MRKYEDSVSSAVTGLPVYLAEIRVLNSGGTPATIYSDNGVTPLTQPALTDGLGHFEFYVVDGTYSLLVADPGGANSRTFAGVEIYEDARNVSVPIGEVGFVLPSAGTRAGLVLGFDGSGAPIATTGTAGPPGTALPSQATVAALRSVASGGHLDGDDIVVNGSVTINDGLGAVFSWSSTSTATDDGVNVVKPTSISSGPGRWIRIDGATVTAKADKTLTNIDGFVFRAKDRRNRKVSEREPYTTDTTGYAAGHLWGAPDGSLRMAQTVTTGYGAWGSTDAANVPLRNYALPLDRISTAALVAVGPVKLRAAYAGNCFQIQRASDSATLDVGFVLIAITARPMYIADWAAADKFVHGTTAVYTIWYDHGALANNVIADGSAPSPYGFNMMNGIRVFSLWGGGQNDMKLPVALSTTRNAVSIVFAGLFEASGHGNCICSLGTDATFSNNLLMTTATQNGLLQMIGNVNRQMVRVESTPSVIGFTSGATATTSYCNDASVSVGAFTASTMTSGYIGYYPGYAAWADYGALMIFDAELNAADMQTLRQSLTWLFGIQPQARDRMVIAGDSIGAGADTPNLPYWRQGYANLDRDFRIYNQSLEGTTLATIISNYTLAAGNLYTAGVRNVLLISAGSNDLGALNAANGASVNAATIISRMQALAALGRASGYLVLVASILPRNNSFSGGQTQPGFESARLIVNSTLQSGYAAWSDGLVDYGSDPLIGAYANVADATLYNGSLHPKERGHAVMTPYFVNAVNALG